MNIGNIEFGDKPLFLAPMEDVTDASFRFICKEFGADMMYTEFISSDGLIRDARKSLDKLVSEDILDLEGACELLGVSVEDYKSYCSKKGE